MAHLRLLGPVGLSVAGRPVDLGPARQRTVFAALLVDAGRTVATDSLIDRVWGENPPPGARSGLYSYVTRLRRALARADAAPPIRLAHAAGGYRLDLGGHRVDLQRFRQLVERARDDAGERPRAAMLAEAIGLSRGVPLADLSGDWVGRIRDTVTHERVEAALLWARLQLRLGPAPAVVALMRELVDEHPFVEPVAAMLMDALRRDDRRAEALCCYRSTRRRLVDELGIEPGPGLRRQYQAILRDDQRRF